MAHYEKYDKYSVEKQLNHDSRKNTDNKDNIDKDKTHLNYNLCDIKNPEKYIENLINKVKTSGGRIRKDSIVMCSCIITLPKTFLDNEELERQFFISSKRFLDEQHGKENCISAVIHKDEPNAMPHLHYRFCPVICDEKKYRLCAKEILNRNYLKSFHTELSKYIEEELGFKVDILNGATKDGHLTIEQLKQKSKLDKEITEQKAVLEKLKTECIKYPDELEKERKRIIDKLWKEYQAKSKAYWNNYKTTKQDINNCIYELKKGIWGTEQQLYRDLDFIGNLSNGLLFALFSLVSAVITLTCKKIMQHELNTLQNDLERLNEQRRKVSNYQNNTKEKLKKEDLEDIEKAMQKWEKSLGNTNGSLYEILEKQEEKYIEYER